MSRDIKSMDAGLAIVLLLLLANHALEKRVFVTTALVLLLICMSVPGFFKPLAKIWHRLSECMSSAMSLVLLTLVFSFLVIPIGCARKLMGKDTLNFSFWRSGNGSLLLERNHRYLPSDLEHPY